MEDKEKKMEKDSYEKPELKKEGQLKDITAELSGAGSAPI